MRKLTTEQFAGGLGLKPGTPRRAYCVKGHFLGAVPTKMGNGRLMWSEDDQRSILELGHARAVQSAA